MKNLLLNLSIVFLSFCLNAQQDSIITPQDDLFCDNNMEPQFPGGSTAMKAYFEKNLIIPASADSLLPVKCYARFIVAASGHISNVEVVKSVPYCPECEEEVIRVIKNMPNWIPDSIQGKPVNSIMHLPVIFVFK